MANIAQLMLNVSTAYKCRTILHKLGNRPTVFMVQAWIDCLGSTQDSIWRGDKCHSVGDFIKLIDDPTRCARLVPIRFIGGPPRGHGHLRPYKGSLHTFLLDRIMYYTEKVGLEATENALGITKKA